MRRSGRWPDYPALLARPGRLRWLRMSAGRGPA